MRFFSGSAERAGIRGLSNLLCLVGWVCLLFFGNPTSAHAQESTEEVKIPDAAWFDIFFRSSDRIAAAAELEPLRKKNLPDAEKEVRIWYGGGMGGYALYRFTGNADHMRGELILSWGAKNVSDDP
jgi:hypothetical protein